MKLTDEQVSDLRSKHGWAKETIRAIEAEVLRLTALKQLSDLGREMQPDHSEEHLDMVERGAHVKVSGPLHVICQCDACKSAPPQQQQAEPVAVLEGWQPIETAPKDGSRVLTYRSGFLENMAVAWYSMNLDAWLPVNGSAWPEPTHWMPLPAAPSAPKPQGE